MPALSTSRARRGVIAGTAASAAVLSLRALSRPIAGSGERRLLDWEAVGRIAHGRTGESGPVGWASAADAAAEYDAMAAELAPRMAEVCLSPVEGFPSFNVLDRRGFIDANLVIAQRLFEPVERLRAALPESRVTALARVLLSRYVGELFGFLSSRVLGQYDPVLMLAPAAPDPLTSSGPTLSLVEPNIAAFERTQGVPGDSLRRWLVLHELTHAWQFEAHPWLREHIAATMGELMMAGLAGAALSGDAAGPSGGAAGGGSDAADQGGDAAGAGGGAPAADQAAPSAIATLRSTVPALRAQLAAAGRIQAVMSVAEGYSNYVMHQVGARHLSDFDRLERGFHARRQQRSLLEQLVLTITGMRLKLRQYELGERFAEAVVAERGLGLLNRVWDGPALMPSMAELREPRRWVTRVEALTHSA